MPAFVVRPACPTMFLFHGRLAGIVVLVFACQAIYLPPQADGKPPLRRPDAMMDTPGFFDFTGGDEDGLPGGVVTVHPGEDIQAAIRRMSDAGGGKVLLAEGTHQVKRPLMLMDNVVLEGVDRDRVLIQNTRKVGSPISQDAFKVGIHHPAFNTPGRGPLYGRITFGTVRKGDRKLNITDWPSAKPPVGSLVMIMSQTHGRDGRGRIQPITHHWVQWVRILDLDGDQVTIDEPIFHDYDAGFLDWPEGVPDIPSGGLPIYFAENVIVRNLTTEGSFAAGRFGVRNLLIENVRNVPRDPPYPNYGLMVNGFYRSTLRGNTIRYNLRAIELKGGSSMSVVEDNTLNYLPPTPEMVQAADDPILYFRPHWGTGEGAYQLCFTGNHVTIPAFFDPTRQTAPFRFSQLGGVVRKNTFVYAGEPIASPWLLLTGGEHPSGGMRFCDNTYRVCARRDYVIDDASAKGLTICNEDWSGSTISAPADRRRRLDAGRDE